MSILLILGICASPFVILLLVWVFMGGFKEYKALKAAEQIYYHSRPTELGTNTRSYSFITFGITYGFTEEQVDECLRSAQISFRYGNNSSPDVYPCRKRYTIEYGERLYTDDPSSETTPVRETFDAIFDANGRITGLERAIYQIDGKWSRAIINLKDGTIRWR